MVKSILLPNNTNSVVAGFRVNSCTSLICRKQLCRSNRVTYHAAGFMTSHDSPILNCYIDNPKHLEAATTTSADLSPLTYFCQRKLNTVLSPNPDWSLKMEWTHNHASMHSSQVSGKKYTNMKIQFRQSFYFQSLHLCTSVADHVFYQTF